MKEVTIAIVASFNPVQAFACHSAFTSAQEENLVATPSMDYISAFSGHYLAVTVTLITLGLTSNYQSSFNSCCIFLVLKRAPQNNFPKKIIA